MRSDRRRWAVVRRKVFERDGYRCRKCGKAGRLECDHVKPLIDFPKQDAWHMDGLQALCRRCHIEKTADERRARRKLTAAETAWQGLVDELR